jgi:hypothetical protein
MWPYKVPLPLDQKVMSLGKKEVTHLIDYAMGSFGQIKPISIPLPLNVEVPDKNTQPEPHTIRQSSSGTIGPAIQSCTTETLNQ